MTVQAKQQSWQPVLAADDEQWIDKSAGHDAWLAVKRAARLFRSPGVAVPGALLLAVLLACFVLPVVVGMPDPSKGDLRDYLLPPGSPGHLLGTNQLGNDLLSRLLHGGQVSLVVGVVSTAIGFVVGVPLGAVAGLYGGWWEAAIMRIFDTLFAFPGLILALAIAAYLGPGEFHTAWALGFFGIAGFGRLAHGQTVRVRVMDYVVAARASAVPARTVVFGHIIPNILAPVLTYGLFAVGLAMMAEAALSYLGLGVQIPQPSWGNIISAGQSSMALSPWQVLFPSLMLFITVLSLNLLSDGLRRALAVNR